MFRPVFIFGCTVSRLKRAAAIQGAEGNGEEAFDMCVASDEDGGVFFFFFPEINDGEGHPSSSHQTLKGTSKWATSLENLLEDPEGVKRFRVAMLTMGISTNQS